MHFGKVLQIALSNPKFTRLRTKFVSYNKLKAIIEDIEALVVKPGDRSGNLNEVKPLLENSRNETQSNIRALQEEFNTKLQLDMERVESTYCQIIQHLKDLAKSAVKSDGDQDLKKNYGSLMATTSTRAPNFRRISIGEGDSIDFGSQEDNYVWRELYSTCLTLQKYCELNREGVRKIAKKFDKRGQWQGKQDEVLQKMGNMDFGTMEELKFLMEECMKYVSTENLPENSTDSGSFLLHLLDILNNSKDQPDKLTLSRVFFVCCSLLVFICMQSVDFPFHHTDPSQGAFSLLLLAVVLWATSIIPLWTTSVLLIFLSVIFELYELPHCKEKFQSQCLAKEILGSVVDPTSFLLLGGMSLTSALRKYKLDERFVQKILSFRSISSDIRRFSLTMMLLGAFLSMWISNVISPTIIAFFVAPAIQNNSDPNIAKILCLAIAFSNNIGGMLTPIASPQNVVAVQILNQYNTSIGFEDWFAAVAPLALLFLLIVWGSLIYFYAPKHERSWKMEPLPVKNFEPLRVQEYFVLAITAITVILWCASTFVLPIFGHLGNIALIPIVAFFGFGILTSEDLRHFDWAIILLLGGGNVLQIVMKKTKLLKVIANRIAHVFAGSLPWVYFLVFNLFLLFISNFISHTVACLTCLNIVAEIGQEINYLKPLVIGATIAASGACALPVSSFPNLISVSIKKNDENVLSTTDFLFTSIIVEVSVYIILTLFGWPLLTTFL